MIMCQRMVLLSCLCFFLISGPIVIDPSPCAIVYTNKTKHRGTVRLFGVFINQHSITHSCRLIGYYYGVSFYKSRLAHQSKLTFDLLDSALQISLLSPWIRTSGWISF